GERHLLPDLGLERGDPDRLAGFDPELFVASADDCVHGRLREISHPSRSGRGLGSGHRRIKSRFFRLLSSTGTIRGDAPAPPTGRPLRRAVTPVRTWP